MKKILLAIKSKAFAVLVMSALIVFSFGAKTQAPVVEAATSAELKAQSDNLNQQINDAKQKAKELAAQGDSLKKTIAGLDVQIVQANSEIQLTGVKIAELEKKLTDTQTELDKQKDALKVSLQSLYKKSGVSTVELLIGSDSFSDFVNNQEYIEKLRSGVQQSTEKVIALKQQIQVQQADQKALLKVQQEQKRAIEESKAERGALLEQTQGDEAKYTAQMAAAISAQQEVNRALFAAIQLERGSGNNGGYPYNDWPFSMQGPGCPSGDGPDRWGECTRQCVSYAAWGVERSGRRAPYGYGDAKDWVWHSQADGIPGGYTPRTGDVAIYTGGTWGHAQYIDSVNSDGTMRISQYNAMLDGRYTEATVSASRSGWYYIHF